MQCYNILQNHKEYPWALVNQIVFGKSVKTLEQYCDHDDLMKKLFQ